MPTIEYMKQRIAKLLAACLESKYRNGFQAMCRQQPITMRLVARPL